MDKTSSIRPRLLLVAALLALGSLLVACGADPSATAPAAAPTVAAPAATPASATGGTSDVTAVTLNEWSIAPASIEVAAGHQKFKITNSGKFPHNFKIMVNGTAVGTENIKAGDTAKLETDLAAGTYDTLCSLPGHKDKGMAGKIVVK